MNREGLEGSGFAISLIEYGATPVSVLGTGKLAAKNDLKHHRVNGGDIMSLIVLVALVDMYE